MATEKFVFTYFNELDDECLVEFKINEYHNLMELLFDRYMQDWGDCKGRAWCGTCHIQIVEGYISEDMGEDEKNTLSKNVDVAHNSRLACQIQSMLNCTIWFLKLWIATKMMKVRNSQITKNEIK